MYKRQEGTVVKLGDNEITCTVEGPARLLGLEGSDNSDMSDYTDNRHRVYHGRLLAYIQTTGGEGHTLKIKQLQNRGRFFGTAKEIGLRCRSRHCR